jgi:signal transduction histidine kinase
MLRENGMTGERHEELLEQTICEADRLLATFKALLRISEVESGSRRAGFKEVDVAALLDDLVELYEPLSEEKGQTLIFVRQQLKPLLGDRDLLFQAFSNVLDNAIKYTPEAGVIRLSVEDHLYMLQISICDTGPGIPEIVHDKVFERFYRLEASRSPPGNGLGLSLVDATVNLHHGQIELADMSPGLSLTIRLPRLF